MDRRNFFRILSVTSAGAAAGGCGNHSDKLIPLLVRENEIVPGEEQWHPAVCTECGAGCGTLVRVMEAGRTVERSGQQLRERIAAIKKVEGNPLDPVSGGRLCARGQATVQALYHPDRLRGPMKRTRERGKGQVAGRSNALRRRSVPPLRSSARLTDLRSSAARRSWCSAGRDCRFTISPTRTMRSEWRSEEHTSELQSR